MNRLLQLFWVFTLGVIIGGAVIPHVNDMPSFPESEPVPKSTKPSKSAARQDKNVPPVDLLGPEFEGLELLWDEYPLHPTPGTTLSWAPTPGADEYFVQLRNGTEIVIERTVSEVNIEVRIDPGEYLWLVYPVTNGLRSSAAIVNSTLRIEG